MSRFGKIIDIDLSTGKIEGENMSQREIRQSLGGFGYNVETLYHRIEPGIDPFDPDNVLVISRGLYTTSLTIGWGDLMMMVQSVKPRTRKLRKKATYHAIS